MAHEIKANGYTVELEKGGTFGGFNTLGWVAFLVADGKRLAFQTYGQLAYAKEAAPKAAAKIYANMHPAPAVVSPATAVPAADVDLLAILFGEN